MYEAILTAKITDKSTGKTSGAIEIMNLKYRVEDNTLWITDHRGCILDYDLNDVDVEIHSKKTK